MNTEVLYWNRVLQMRLRNFYGVQDAPRHCFSYRRELDRLDDLLLNLPAVTNTPTVGRDPRDSRPKKASRRP